MHKYFFFLVCEIDDVKKNKKVDSARRGLTLSFSYIYRESGARIKRQRRSTAVAAAAAEGFFLYSLRFCTILCTTKTAKRQRPKKKPIVRPPKWLRHQNLVNQRRPIKLMPKRQPVWCQWINRPILVFNQNRLHHWQHYRRRRRQCRHLLRRHRPQRLWLPHSKTQRYVTQEKLYENFVVYIYKYVCLCLFACVEKTSKIPLQKKKKKLKLHILIWFWSIDVLRFQLIMPAVLLHL